jgi:protein involved in polysaccharide export with SLBB domain
MDNNLTFRNRTVAGCQRRRRPFLIDTDGTSLKKFLRIVEKLGLCAFALCVSCQTPTKVQRQLPAQTPGVLAPEDVLKISFTGAPELNQTQKIPADGKLSMPLIGDVYAAGKTLGQLQSELTRLYQPQLQNSEVVVSLESRALPVVVSGAVQKPGKIVFERPATILEAIMEAGGFTPEADLKKVSLIRNVNGYQRTEMFDLRPVLRGVPTRATYVSGGDVIFIPEKLLNF